MARSYESEVQTLLPLSAQRRYSRRRFHLRRKKVPTARLGGKREARAVAFFRLIREMRRKWVVRLRCACMVKKLSQLLGSGGGGGGGGFDAFQKRLLMEISFAIPVLGASFPL